MYISFKRKTMQTFVDGSINDKAVHVQVEEIRADG